MEKSGFFNSDGELRAFDEQINKKGGATPNMDVFRQVDPFLLPSRGLAAPRVKPAPSPYGHMDMMDDDYSMTDNGNITFVGEMRGGNLFDPNSKGLKNATILKYAAFTSLVPVGDSKGVRPEVAQSQFDQGLSLIKTLQNVPFTSAWIKDFVNMNTGSDMPIESIFNYDEKIANTSNPTDPTMPCVIPKSSNKSVYPPGLGSLWGVRSLLQEGTLAVKRQEKIASAFIDGIEKLAKTLHTASTDSVIFQY